MTNALEFKEGKAVCRVVGSMTVLVVNELLKDVQTILERGCHTFIFDFKETTFVDSTGLRVAVTVWRKLGKEKTVLMNLSGEVLNSFSQADLLQDFTIR